ncbi:MAG TPA: LLM class flavin-dependent oxidoreductase [Phototrophicaceae bacterium]|nr:LLM class flavin-dependent oxidoreductase [Phototrophicaceae bacterium]
MTHSPQFGYCVPIFAWPGGGLFRTPNFPTLDVHAAIDNAKLADSLGYDSIWVADHVMLGKDQAIMEGWTTLAAIAGGTSRAKLGIIHQGHFFRYPAIAAKMIATLDQITSGRFIYFTDTGTRANEHHAYGLHFADTPEERIPEFLEGLDLILKLWQTDEAHPLTYNGQFYHTDAAVCQPHPFQQPHPPIWFGEAHPLTLDAAARLGDGWNTVPVGMVKLRERLDALRAACAKVGRDFNELEISYETQILIAPTREGVREKLKAMLALTPAGVETPQDDDFKAFVSGASDEYPKYITESLGLIGTPDEIKQQLQDLIGLGATHFMLWFMDAPDNAGMRLFIDQVAPAFRS